MFAVSNFALVKSYCEKKKKNCPNNVNYITTSTEPKYRKYVEGYGFLEFGKWHAIRASVGGMGGHVAWVTC